MRGVRRDKEDTEIGVMVRIQIIIVLHPDFRYDYRSRLRGLVP
jgi:hypothetical protein